MNLSYWSSTIWRNVIYLEVDITKCFIIAWRWYYLTCNSTPTLSNFGQHKHMVYLTIVMLNFLKFAAKNFNDNLCEWLRLLSFILKSKLLGLTFEFKPSKSNANLVCVDLMCQPNICILLIFPTRLAAMRRHAEDIRFKIYLFLFKVMSKGLVGEEFNFRALPLVIR